MKLSNLYYLCILSLLSFSPPTALTAHIPVLNERQAPLPAIPPPPADPPKPANDGAGPYKSQTPTMSDKLHYKEFQAMVFTADKLGLDNAARNLDH
jgi:hypothetical protein